jgi:hypothetical protein
MPLVTQKTSLAHSLGNWAHLHEGKGKAKESNHTFQLSTCAFIPSEDSFKNKGGIKTFLAEQELRLTPVKRNLRSFLQEEGKLF